MEDFLPRLRAAIAAAGLGIVLLFGVYPEDKRLSDPLFWACVIIVALASGYILVVGQPNIPLFPSWPWSRRHRSALSEWMISRIWRRANGEAKRVKGYLLAAKEG